jgi:hypothetical protein
MTKECQKRRTIVHKSQDGSKRTYYRCANGGANTYRQKVTDEVCDGCVLRQEVMGVVRCSPKLPVKPIYSQPTLGKNSEIRYEPQDAAEPPECPEGYVRRKDDQWSFDSEWFPCPYRAFSDELKPSGSLQVHAFCTIGRKKITCEGCKQCEGELISIDGSLQLDKTPETPALFHQARNYWQAVKSWIAAGRPVRTDLEVREIHTNYCLECDWYDKPSQRCKGCGCKVRPGGVALLNKAKMATEHCPRDFW